MSRPPAATRHPHTDHYHGTSVADPYRWLERGEDAEAIAWVHAQNAHTETLLSGFGLYDPLLQEFQTVIESTATRVLDVLAAGEHLVALRQLAGAARPELVRWPRSILRSCHPPETPERVHTGDGTAIDWYVPSPDGRRVAVSLSRGGSESGDVHVWDFGLGAMIDCVPRVNSGSTGGSLAWLSDHQSFCYTQQPDPGLAGVLRAHAPVRIHRHTIGNDTTGDPLELGDSFPSKAYIELHRLRGSGRIVAQVQDGHDPPGTHYIREADGQWWQLGEAADGIVDVHAGPRGGLVLLVRGLHPNGVVLQLNSEQRTLQSARVLLPGSERVLGASRPDRTGIAVLGDEVVVCVQQGGPVSLISLNEAGEAHTRPLLPAVRGVQRLRPTPDGLLLHVSSEVRSEQWLQTQTNDDGLVETPLSTHPAQCFEGARVLREIAYSKDGTAVPLTIVPPPKGQCTLPARCVVTAYGGFGLAMAPRFRPENQCLYKRGVIWVTAHIRGGGEYGLPWHDGGRRAHKQNGFDDFAAVLDHLVAQGYTTPAQTGIIGASNGAILMGAMLAQHPEKMGAVVSQVGIYDMLRLEDHPNGRLLAGEYGSVAHPEDFEVLRAYSPYHNLREGRAYPATLITAGANDSRADPMHSRKFAARLQAAQTGPAPILLRIYTDQGHLAGSLQQQMEKQADITAFLLQHLEG